MIHISPDTMVNSDHVIAISKTSRPFELKFFCTYERTITVQFKSEEERETAMMDYKRRA